MPTVGRRVSSKNGRRVSLSTWAPGRPPASAAPNRPAMFEHESGRRVALRILHTQRIGDESFGQHARRHSVAGWILRGQCTGESKTWGDRDARKPFAGLVRNIFPGWEHPEIVPYH